MEDLEEYTYSEEEDQYTHGSEVQYTVESEEEDEYSPGSEEEDQHAEESEEGFQPPRVSDDEYLYTADSDAVVELPAPRKKGRPRVIRSKSLSVGANQTVIWRPTPDGPAVDLPAYLPGRKRPRANDRESTSASKRSRTASKSPTPAKRPTAASKKASPASKASTPASRKATPASRASTAASRKVTPTPAKSTPASKKTTPASKKTTPASRKTTPASRAATPASRETTPAAKTPAKRGRKPKSTTISPAPAFKESTPSTGSSAAKPTAGARRGRKKIAVGDYGRDSTSPRVPRSDLEQLGLATWKTPPHVTPSTPGHEGWSQAECDLFNHLNDRGAVPLMPTTWQLDFPTFPQTLFGEDEDLLMRPLGSNFRAIKAFNALLTTGPRIRDRLDGGGDPTPILAGAIKAFLKWSRTDAELTHAVHAPNIFLGIVGADTEPQAAVNAVDARVRRAGDRFRVRWGLDPDPAAAPRQGWLGGLKGGGNRPSRMVPSDRETTPSSRRASSIFSLPSFREATPPTPSSRRSSSIFSLPSFREVKPPTPSPKTTVVRKVGRKAKIVVVEAEPSIELPTLYTMIVARSVVSFATYESAVGPSLYDPAAAKYSTDIDVSTAPEVSTTGSETDTLPTPDALKQRRLSQGRPTRHIATFSWGDEGQDVWNALAVALIVLVARRWVLKWEEAVGGFPEGEVNEADYWDVDA